MDRSINKMRNEEKMEQNNNGFINADSQAQFQNTAYSRAVPPVKPPKKKKSFPIILICLLLVLVLLIADGIIIAHFLKSRKSGSATSPEKSTATQLSVCTDENGDFMLLSGSFDDTISSESEAMDFIANHSADIGIKDASAELSFLEKTSYNDITYYKFKQVLNGVPVYGNELIVTVAPDGKVEAVNGRYTPVKADTDAAKSQEEAEAAAKEHGGEEANVLSCELTVLTRPESGDPLLVYDICVTGKAASAELLMNADTCEIIEEYPLYSEAFDNLNVNINGSIYNANLENSILGGYNIFDPERDIMVSDGCLKTALSQVIANKITGGHTLECFIPLSGTVISENADGSVDLDVGSYISDGRNIDFATHSILALDSVKNAYDMYARFGWNSLDGENMPIKIIVNVPDALASVRTGNELINDFCSTFGMLIPIPGKMLGAAFIEKTNTILVGVVGDQPCAGKGALGHEFTHGVICYKSRLNNSIGSKTVNEGYADVMGSIAANDWEFMQNEFPSSWYGYQSVVRSAIDPGKNDAPSKVGGEHYVPFTYVDDAGETKHADEHDNATIVSHAGYLMSQKGLTNDEIAELFYNSMNNLTTSTGFEQASISLIISADSLSFSQEKKDAVREALYETNMYKPQGKTYIHVHSGSRNLKKATITINGNIVGKTDRNGDLVLDFDEKWYGKVKIRAKAKGYDSASQIVSLNGGKVMLDFNLSRTDPDKKTEGQVKLTILNMTEPENMDKAEVFYIDKGSTIDLEDIVDKLGMFGVSTDGIKLYYDINKMVKKLDIFDISGDLTNEETRIELSYRIHGTNETFDFSEPLYEDVIIEPMIGIGGESYSFQDFIDIKEGIESIFVEEESTVSE